MTDDDTAPPLTEAAEAIARLAEIVKDLERQRDSARRWSVALESWAVELQAQNALLKRGAANAADAMVCVMCGRVGTRGFVISSGNGDGTRDTYRCANFTACEKRQRRGAALTGGEDDAEK